MSISLLVQLLLGIASSIPAFLDSEGIISAGLEKLFEVSLAAVTAIIAAIRSGGTAASELQSALSALQAEYTAIQQNTSADPVVLGEIAEVSLLVGDAIQGFENAQTVDPSTLPVPPLP